MHWEGGEASKGKVVWILTKKYRQWKGILALATPFLPERRRNQKTSRGKPTTHSSTPSCPWISRHHQNSTQSVFPRQQSTRINE